MLPDAGVPKDVFAMVSIPFAITIVTITMGGDEALDLL